ncbi:unnamed protein product [Symbiodinium sp. KB8]|nr:unnamed protein product [Symbiodinium sp. KB8]
METVRGVLAGLPPLELEELGDASSLAPQPEAPSPAGSVYTPVNAPSTYWRTTICPSAPHKRHPPRPSSAESTPRSCPTPTLSWPSAPSPTNYLGAFGLPSPMEKNSTLSSAFPQAFVPRTVLRRACTLPTAPEHILEPEEELVPNLPLDRTISEPHNLERVLLDAPDTPHRAKVAESSGPGLSNTSPDKPEEKNLRRRLRLASDIVAETDHDCGTSNRNECGLQVSPAGKHFGAQLWKPSACSQALQELLHLSLSRAYLPKLPSITFLDA